MRRKELKKFRLSVKIWKNKIISSLTKLITISFKLCIKKLILFSRCLLTILFLNIKIFVWSLELLNRISIRIFLSGISLKLHGKNTRISMKRKNRQFLSFRICIGRNEKWKILVKNHPREDNKLRYDLTFINCTLSIFFIYFSFSLSFSFSFYFLIWLSFSTFSDFYISFYI